MQGDASAAIARTVRGGRRAKLYGQVVEQLGLRIVRGDFDATGALPVEPQLAAELGVNRNLLREAVKVLASKGLPDVGPRSGTRVRPQPDWHLLDPDVLAWLDASGQRLERSFGLAEFRLIVEPAASYLAATRATDAERQGIMAALGALEACVGHPELVPARDIALHQSIHAASHNPVLSHLGSLISSLMQVQVQTTTDRPGDFERGLLLHRELAEAIARGAAEEAEDASRRLVRMPCEDLPARPAPLPAAPGAQRGHRVARGGRTAPFCRRRGRGDLTRASYRGRVSRAPLAAVNRRNGSRGRAFSSAPRRRAGAFPPRPAGRFVHRP